MQLKELWGPDDWAHLQPRSMLAHFRQWALESPENLSHSRSADAHPPCELRPVRDLSLREHPPPLLRALLGVLPGSADPSLRNRPTEIH